MKLNFKHILLICFSITLCSWSQESRNIEFENRLRIGYDDNLDNKPDVSKKSTLYYSELINITGKFEPASNQSLMLFWQPELRYRVDAADKQLFLQDLYLNHITRLDQVTQIQLTDRYRVAEPDVDQVDGRGYNENDFKAAYRRQIDRQNDFYVYIQNVFREYKNNIRTPSQSKDFDRYSASGIFNRVLDPKRSIAAGIAHTAHEINDNAGSMTSITLFGGYDQAINPRLTTSMQIGYTDADIEQQESQGSRNSSSPFLEIGTDYEVSEQTQINFSYSYSLRFSTLSDYNAEVRSDWLCAMKHEFTPKINVAAAFSYIYNKYELNFQRDVNDTGLFDDSTTLSLNIRGEYIINRNHAAELGYKWSTRDSGISAQEYDRNKVYLGWKYNI